MEEMRSLARRLFDRAKKTKNGIGRDRYRKALTDYNKELKRSKKRNHGGASAKTFATFLLRLVCKE